MEASSRFVSPGYTKVVFEVSATGLEPDECVAVVGRHDNIGAWDVSKALILARVDKDSNTWKGNAWLPTSVATPYKYVVLKNYQGLRRMIKWETIVGSRFILPGVANLARAKPTWQSSTYKRHEASKAVNGSFFATAYNCSMTDREVDPWWQVDLGSSVPVERINVWTRPHPECTAITVTLSSHPVFPITSTSDHPSTFASLPDSQAAKVWTSKRWRINPDETYDLLPWQVGRELRSGKTKPSIRDKDGNTVVWGSNTPAVDEPDVPCFRFVAVRGHGYASLQLAEVEVFSLISDIIASGAQCVQSHGSLITGKLDPNAYEGHNTALPTSSPRSLLPPIPQGGKMYVMWSEHSRYTVQLAPLGKSGDGDEYTADEGEFPSEAVDEDLSPSLEASVRQSQSSHQPVILDPLERLKNADGDNASTRIKSISQASHCPSSGFSRSDAPASGEAKQGEEGENPGQESDAAPAEQTIHGNMQLSLWSDRGLLPVAILQEVFDGVFGVDVRQPQPEARTFTDSIFLGPIARLPLGESGSESKDFTTESGEGNGPASSEWDPGSIKLMLGGLEKRASLSFFDAEAFPKSIVEKLDVHLSVMKGGKLKQQTELWIREVEHATAEIKAWFISATVLDDPCATLSLTLTYPLAHSSGPQSTATHTDESPEPTVEHIPIAQAYLVKDNMARNDYGEFSVPVLGLPGMATLKAALLERGEDYDFPQTPFIPVGQALIRFLVIKPFKHPQNNISKVWRTYWRARPTLHVGHRGVGRSYKQGAGFRKAALRENTLISFITASAMGSDLIEFDVLLTQDRVPVVYHDFQLEVAIANKTRATEEEMETGIHELKWRQLRAIKLHHLREGIKRTGLARLLRKHWGGVIEYAKKRRQSRDSSAAAGDDATSSSSLLSESALAKRNVPSDASVRSDMAFSSAASEFSSSSSVLSYGSETNFGGMNRNSSSDDIRRLLHPEHEERAGANISPDLTRSSPAKLSWSPHAIEKTTKLGVGSASDMASPPNIGEESLQPGGSQGVALAAPVARGKNRVGPGGPPARSAQGRPSSPFRSMDVDDSRPSSRGSITDFLYRSRTPKGADIGSLASALHEIPTLQALFMHLPPHLGFDVEIKYPIERKHVAVAQSDVYFQMNAYVDSILKVVFDYGDKRRIMFSCFHPEICTLLRMKQARYPVLFLSDAGRSPEHYDDKRCTSIEAAVDFAKSESLQGIVSESRPVLDDPTWVDRIHGNGLLLFTWGDRNTDPACVELQRKMGVDAVISDNIGDHTTAVGKVSQFLKFDNL